MEQSPVLTVSQLNQIAREILEANFPQVWVEGEISNCIQPGSGHLYFSLKDQTAQIRCAMFRGANTYLKFIPKNGLQVVVRGRISLYVARGEYQLVVESMIDAGEGLLRQKFEQLKAQLFKEGLFDTQFKKPLPKFPQTIGVITSPTGAVIQDIRNILKRRFPSAVVIVYPTLVQGTEAAAQIAKAIGKANERAECDCLILARGGGSLEDLWPFNEEVVARAIFASQLPLISAVGHETDVTIADFVADIRAPTPSAAAELVCPHTEEWLEKLAVLKNRLAAHMSWVLQSYQTKLSWLQKYLKHPAYRIQDYYQRLDEVLRRFIKTQNDGLYRKKNTLENILGRLKSLSPLATLERGYAIVTSQQKIVRDAEELKVGEVIEARLARGTVVSTVTK